jgi:hypothetical protein
MSKGPSTLAFFASVSPSVMAPLPNCLLCFSRVITYVKKQRKQLGSGTITDEVDRKTGELIRLRLTVSKDKRLALLREAEWRRQQGGEGG